MKIISAMFFLLSLSVTAFAQDSAPNFFADEGTENGFYLISREPAREPRYVTCKNVKGKLPKRSCAALTTEFPDFFAAACSCPKKHAPVKITGRNTWTCLPDYRRHYVPCR